MDRPRNDDDLFLCLNELFDEKIPFNKVLGLKVESLSRDGVTTSFEMKDYLLGHVSRGMLHGGVISSVIDVTGGLSAFMGIEERMMDENIEAKLARFGKVNTLDLRVDYLRPGRGKRFVAKAHALRTGKKVAVTRIELRNEMDDLIAVGTGSYIVA
ncbi:MAG: thioesterase family protein [Syntrophobacterales bacterium]|jgi:uncharacterized protein (TIGR00369 family)|nr:thioesterase family protein [Syntrophobacterales bacterium]